MDDATVEDEIDLNEYIAPSATQATHQTILSQLLNPAGFTVIFCFLLTLGWVFWKRRSLQRVGESSSTDSAARYEQMERIRQRQQQEYEERTRRRLEEKQARLDAMKTSASTNDNATRTKFRSIDHNPLTGQSMRSDGGSCSWRPSARRKPAGG